MNFESFVLFVEKRNMRNRAIVGKNELLKKKKKKLPVVNIIM